MGEVLPIPRLGAVVRDVRGAGRALRVSWHGEDGLVVLSLWDGPRCTGTVRIAAADAPVLIEALQLGLAPPPASEPAASPGPPPPSVPPPAPPTAEALRALWGPDASTGLDTGPGEDGPGENRANENRANENRANENRADEATG